MKLLYLCIRFKQHELNMKPYIITHMMISVDGRIGGIGRQECNPYRLQLASVE